MQITKKRCCTCKTHKELSEFPGHRGKADGKGVRCKSCHAIANAKWNRKHPEKKAATAKAYLVKSQEKRHNLPTSQKQIILEAQGYRCAICLNEPTGTWHTDHDHRCCPSRRSCGQCIRGLLCSQCNTGLGLFRDSIVSLRNAMQYLEKGPLHLSLQAPQEKPIE